MTVRAASDVSGTPASAEDLPLLEVVVQHPADAAAAAAGEADEVLVVADAALGGITPERTVVAAIRRETDLPLRVLLRESGEPGADPAQVQRLAGLAETFLDLGADALSFGFLDRDLEIDVAACQDLASRFPGIGWTFHRGFDLALEPRRAWAAVAGLPGLQGVCSAGSSLSLASGIEELYGRISRDAGVRDLVQICGGIEGEWVPWLVRAGAFRFQIGTEARPGGSWARAYVDPGHVRAWRLLLDDAHQRARGVPVG